MSSWWWRVSILGGVFFSKLSWIPVFFPAHQGALEFTGLRCWVYIQSWPCRSWQLWGVLGFCNNRCCWSCSCGDLKKNRWTCWFLKIALVAQFCFIRIGIGYDQEKQHFLAILLVTFFPMVQWPFQKFSGLQRSGIKRSRLESIGWWVCSKRSAYSWLVNLHPPNVPPPRNKALLSPKFLVVP